MRQTYWEKHYKKNKSLLTYPDENLVRMLSSAIKENQSDEELTVLDLGCGSGRHLKLLSEFNIKNIIGMDSSYNGISVCRQNYSYPLVQMDNRRIPLKDSSVDFIIAWGSLHYNHKDDLPVMIEEIHRILKINGHLMATLRTDRDSCMKKGTHLGNDIWKTDLADINGALVSFYKQDELENNFNSFNTFNYGIMERSIVGNIKMLISHWVIDAVK